METPGTKEETVARFLRRHRLPDSFRTLIDEHYMPLVGWLRSARTPGQLMLLGVNGAQGTGKSTLADFLAMTLGGTAGWRVAVVSIDDFYLTRAQRQQLAARVHPLLATRGVPGTHDLDMLTRCLADLNALGEGDELILPRFDKSRDDRANEAAWPTVNGPIHLVILEGWCVGSGPERTDELVEPLNALERDEDRDGSWRRFVNDQLAGRYAEIFSTLDALLFLKVPNFDCVFQWRQEQEEKLADSTRNHGAGLMNRDQVARFIQNFERVTRANLRTLTGTADVVLEFDDQHRCVRSVYRDQGTSDSRY